MKLFFRENDDSALLNENLVLGGLVVRWSKSNPNVSEKAMLCAGKAMVLQDLFFAMPCRALSNLDDILLCKRKTPFLGDYLRVVCYGLYSVFIHQAPSL